MALNICHAQQLFQSTHSRGVRQKGGENLNVLLEFQSTHSRGVRLNIVKSEYERKIISIHALARSATLDIGQVVDFVMISIHALARSATANMEFVREVSVNFNPRTREECDRNILLVIAEIIFKIHYLLFNPYIRIKQNISIFT